MYEVQRNDLSDSDDDGTRGGDRESRMARRSDTCCVIMQVLTIWCTTVPKISINYYLTASSLNSAGQGCLSVSSAAAWISTEPDLRNEAAGVLLSVVEMAIEERGQMLRRVLGQPKTERVSSPVTLMAEPTFCLLYNFFQRGFDSESHVRH